MTVEDQHFLNRLVALGILPGDLVKAKNSQLEHSVREKGMTRALIEQFGLSENAVADAICKESGFGKMLIVNEIETAPTQLLTEDEIHTYRTVPIFCIGLELTMAFTDPPSRQLRTHLQKMTGFQILPVITTVSDFDAAVKKYRGTVDRVQRIGSTVDLEKYDIRKSVTPGRAAISEKEADATIAQLVDELLLRAAKMGASDIHIEPAEDELMIRFRIDGMLQRILSLPTAYHKGMISVIKAKSGMDMFERSIPQDGRMTLNAADRVFDVRVNSLPMLLGEKIVLRLLGKTAMMTNLENLGFSQKNLDMFRTLMRLPNGIILVTGPTGSGKTTTLYSALNEMKDIGRNITTVENPVEYKLPLINQVQVNADRGLTFASVLRAILRQDPNVILVGEIRDAETGIIATEAALTGHLVLSTLHTNDAIGAISRLVNLGVASFWVSASVIGVLAQRLVRKICERCKEEYTPEASVLESFGLSNLPKDVTLFRGRGCSFCNGVGYKGRMAIHEILILTEEMRDVIYGEVTTTKLRNLAMANNFQDMYFDGLRKALAGITTLEEVQRVARRAI
ncbi:MAG: GspE/PulE family protein [Ignavibacteriae bacterium]|nr:GspE/PulE family protein [Ignavibacteriota bacterium]